MSTTQWIWERRQARKVTRPERAQEPKHHKHVKKKDINIQILYDKDLKHATLNVKSLKRAGMRKIIEYWMLKESIDVLAIQETHINKLQKESRLTHVCFFATNPKLSVEKIRSCASSPWL